MNYLQRYQEYLGLVPDGIIGPKSAAAMMKDLGITDKLFFAHLIGQMAHESGLYRNFRENLNYDEPGLLNVFRKYYRGRPNLAKQHARKPQAIANYVYANRMGNGDVASGDGWFYRGAFGLQLTGKDNFLQFFKYAGLPPDTDPDSLDDNPRMYFLAGKFWFVKNGADKLCTSTKDSCIMQVSKKVNLGDEESTAKPNGFADRKQQTKAIFRAVGLA